MRLRILICVLFSGMLFYSYSCGTRIGDVQPIIPGVPSWATGYPKATTGITTADISLKLSLKSKVYWVVANQAIVFTPQDLVSQASIATNPAIIAKGISTVASNTEKTESITSLIENKDYFGYLIAQGDSSSLLQKDVKSLLFKTAMAPPAQPGVPSWTAGYPSVPFGAVSADILLKVDKRSKVYWVLADQAITLTPQQLKDQATTSTNPAIKFKGISTAEANIEKIELTTGLIENTKYFAYVVGESIADAAIQPDVKTFSFTTYKRQDQGEYTSVAESRKVLFLIYRPEDALKYPAKKYPICFFLGGNGEVAAQGQINMIRNGSLPEFISNGNNVPMMVMSIQHTNTNWNTTLIDEGIDYGLANFPSDAKRVYLTGISGGGFGCWAYAMGHAAKLTAIVPISGGGNTGTACNIKGLPIWAFHNQTDGIVNISASTNMINAINACADPKLTPKFTIFPSTGHDCWRRVYDKNHPEWNVVANNVGVARFDIYDWLLTNTK
jgi:predicted peptidase